MKFFCLSIGVILAVIVKVSAGHFHPELPSAPDFQRVSAAAEELKPAFWNNKAKNLIKGKVNGFKNEHKAKNVIFFLGDGMAISTLTVTRTFIGQSSGNTGEENELSFEKFPVSGLAKTYCVDSQVADSACTSTAYLGGVKTNIGTLGVTPNIKFGNCSGMTESENQVQSIAKWFLEDNRSAGVVTTTDVTDASPGGVYAHSACRVWQSDQDIVRSGFDPNLCPDIAHQLIKENVGSQLKVIMGGGRQQFLPNTTVDEQGRAGRRWDGRNLIQEWKLDKAAKGATSRYIGNRAQLASVDPTEVDYLLGLFASGDLSYHLKADSLWQPTLEEMTETAINVLSKDKNGYFLFVEGGKIDHGHHENNARIAIGETIEFNKAIQKAVDMVNIEETLIVVTADHAHTMSINGYPKRGSPILGETGKKASDGLRYMTLSYANGEGYRKEVDGNRANITEEDIESIDFKNQAMVPLSTETHGGDDVAVFSFGPGQHLFSGMYEQNAIHHFIRYASCVDPNLSICSSAPGMIVSWVTLLAALLVFCLR